MSISWGNWAVRVYAANAWVSLAPRFAAGQPAIVDNLEAILADRAPEVRLQAAQNLQVISQAAPERMWAMGERIAAHEPDDQILAAYLERSMRRFSHSDPERCEAVLAIVKARLDANLATDHTGRNIVQEALGDWTAQLFGGQGRALARTWLEHWADDPTRYGNLIDSFVSSLRGAFFARYSLEIEAEACAICDRAQESLTLILTSATRISNEAYDVLASDAGEADKQIAGKQYSAAESVIYQAMNQLYFGSGAHAGEREEGAGLPDGAAMARFLTDYADILALLACTREPAALHHLVQLYEFLIPGNPVIR